MDEFEAKNEEMSNFLLFNVAGCGSDRPESDPNIREYEAGTW